MDMPEAAATAKRASATSHANVAACQRSGTSPRRVVPQAVTSFLTMTFKAPRHAKRTGVPASVCLLAPQLGSS